MQYLAIAVAWIAGVAGSVYLEMHGHSWFAVGILLGVLSLRATG